MTMKRNGIPMLTAAMLLVAGAGQEALAQGMKIYFTDGTPVEYDIQKIDRVEFGESLPVETPDYVDLGLPSGTMWATFNIGAGSPEECGGYYAWGETETKDTYSWANYQLCDGSYLAMNKYCTDEYYGTVDGLKALDDTDDAATALLGEGWSIPTREQFEELVNSEYTTRSRTTQAGVEGLKVTSKTNGKSIFLPVGGYRDGTSSYNESNGYYWTKDLYAGIDNQARSFSVEGNSVGTGDSKSRRSGLNIRAVYKEPEHEYVDLGLPSGTLWAATNVGAEAPENYGNYFAWGETEQKENYTWKTYKFCAGLESEFLMNENYLTKYNMSDYWSYYNEYRYTHILQEIDDAATANWGTDWQTPDMCQWIELINGEYTTIEFVTISSYRYGARITSKKNGKSIFLPMAGYYDGEGRITNWAYYWTRNHSDLGAKPYLNAYNIRFDIKQTNYWCIILSANARCIGCSIRPVRKKK